MTRSSYSICPRGIALTRAALAAASLMVAAASSAQDAPPVAAPPEASAPAPAPASPKKAGKAVGFKVEVTGEGKPVRNAEVRVKPAIGEELRVFTNASGEASFQVAPGAAKVRVLATGWVSKSTEATIADGGPRKVIALER